MKKTLLMLAALLCCCFALKAQDFTYENLNYHVTGTNPPTVELTGHTEGFTAHDFVIPSTVEDNDGTSYSVTSIGNYAFFNCSGFTGSLTIGNSVERIGEEAFSRCSGFTGSLVIPNSVTIIGGWAFYSCSGFTGSLTIGNSVTNIGSSAFYYCSGFKGSLTIGNSVSSIGQWAFGFTSFAQIIAKPATPPTLGSSALEYISDVQSIFVPCGSVNAYKSNWNNFANMIKGGSFEYELTAAPSSTQLGTASITQYSDCTTGLSTVVATPAANYVFANWTENGVRVSTTNPYTLTMNSDRSLVANFFKQYDFSAICETGQTLYYRIIDAEQHLVSIVAPNGDDWHGWDGFNRPTGEIMLPETVTDNRTTYTVTAIGDCAFYECDGLAGSLVIPNSVTSIGAFAYSECSGFTGTLSIGNSVKNIENYAFHKCSDFIGSLTIPNSVESIGWYAFYKCSGITSIIAKPATPPALGNNAFSDMTESLSITVPCGKENDYKDSWSVVADKIAEGFVYVLTVASANPDFGTASITQHPDCGKRAEVIAMPADGYKFVNWTENGVQVSTFNPYTFTMTGDRNLVANFTITDQYDFSATCTTGQTLYYRIIDAEQNFVSIVAPNSDNVNGWNGYTKPTGDITLPETVTHNGTCYTVTAIGDQSFNSCFGLTGTLNIPNSVTSIGNDAFFRCDGFSSLIIGNSVTSIGADAFWECHGLTGSLTIPNSVESIGEYAFNGLGYDGTLTIGNAVTSIGTSAFAYTKFAHIISKPTTPPTLGTNAFSNMTELLSITVPCGKENDYKDSWSVVADKIDDGFVHDLTVTSSNPDFGTASIMQQATCENPQATVSATPNPSYIFTGWTENDVQVSNTTTYTFTMTGDRNLVANFAAKPTYNITVSANSTDAGTVTATCGGEPVESAIEGTSITVSATPNDGYKFVNWTENGDVVSSNNPYTFELTSDRNLVANFTITDQYDFTAICATGQKLYYRIIDAEQHWVSIVPPNSDNAWECYKGYAKPIGNISLPETVSHNDISYTVKAIGVCAFFDCYGLTGSLTIPNSVTNIGGDAFCGCTSFTGSLTIPNSVTNIGEGAFADCSNFTGSLIIPNSVEGIGVSAFEECSGFTGTLTIPNSVTSIGEGAFAGCKGFTGSLTIPNSVTSIGEGTFYKCLGFTGSLTIGSSVTSIGEGAFEACSGFTGTLTIPNSVTSIGDYAFQGCSGFSGSLTIGSSVTSINFLAFNNCNFTSIISKAAFAPIPSSKIPDATNNVYIPAGMRTSYESAWGGYDYIFIEYEREDYHFNGTDNEWNTAANWEENEVPSMPCHNAFVNTNCIFNATGDNVVLHSVNVAAGKTLTIAEDYTLTADCITLENGAQLVNNGTVACNDITVKKAIEGYGEGAGNWHLISSPVAATFLPVGMATAPAEDYDLYCFSQTGDEENKEWLNYKAGAFQIENQRGYLYANGIGTTILFRGKFAAANAKPLAYDADAEFAGFNLVGNPYPCNATISGTNLRSSNYYYKMNALGTNLEVVANPVLAPCTGVFAVAANSDATVTFTQASGAANVTRGEKSSLQDIRVELLADGKVIDRAYLNMNGESLPKFRLQDNASEICFYQNKEELAVASTSSAGRTEMPLNFKAAKNGTYTITVNVDNADLNYLHLVDNLTGNDVDLMAAAASTGSASYTFDAKTDDYASRFKLVFGVKDETSEASENFAFISNGEIIVSNEGRATLQVIDVLGRIVSSEEIIGECRISTNGMTAGVYILNLNGKTQKIVVE